MSLSKKIQNMLSKNPDMEISEIAKKTGANKQYVYTVKWKMRNAGASTKVGRPRKSDIPTLNTGQDEITALRLQNADLEHQIIGYRAVISYLESLAFE